MYFLGRQLTLTLATDTFRSVVSEELFPELFSLERGKTDSHAVASADLGRPGHRSSSYSGNWQLTLTTDFDTTDTSDTTLFRFRTPRRVRRGFRRGDPGRSLN